MNDQTITSVDQLAKLIQSAEIIGAEKIQRIDGIDEVYQWINDLLIRLRYRFLRKKEKGIIRRYLCLYAGYTESHIDHLIAAYQRHGKIVRRKRTQPVFRTIYTPQDIALLADVATGYQHQNGRALKEVCREMYVVYHDPRFIRLAKISVSRLYDLKQTAIFRLKAKYYKKTRSTPVNIGERKKPYPEGKPGFLRVDSVHQGDQDKAKGVYHVHLVDEVTQVDITICVQGISERFLLPALEAALAQFPFQIINFHSDNGSEYINHVVAKLLEKLRITQTKSRSRRTNDNALVEGKNAAVIRKYMGYMHIPQQHADAINDFYRQYFNPFINFHRFCAFPDEATDARGKIVKRYRTYLTPVEKLLTLDHVEQYLKVGITIESLRAKSRETTHLAAAQEMQQAKANLFKAISTQSML